MSLVFPRQPANYITMDLRCQVIFSAIAFNCAHCIGYFCDTIVSSTQNKKQISEATYDVDTKLP